MNFEEYQKIAHTTAKYPVVGQGFVYPVLGLAGEAGELANKVKKVFRDDEGALTNARKEEIKKEMGDILWYLAEISTALGLSLDDIAVFNLEKLKIRKETNKITGDGDNR